MSRITGMDGVPPKLYEVPVTVLYRLHVAAHDARDAEELIREDRSWTEDLEDMSPGLLQIHPPFHLRSAPVGKEDHLPHGRTAPEEELWGDFEPSEDFLGTHLDMKDLLRFRRHCLAAKRKAEFDATQGGSGSNLSNHSQGGDDLSLPPQDDAPDQPGWLQ